MIPFRIDPVELSPSFHYLLSTPHWLDAIEPPLEPHLIELSLTVRKLLKKDASLCEPCQASISQKGSNQNNKLFTLLRTVRWGMIFVFVAACIWLLFRWCIIPWHVEHALSKGWRVGKFDETYYAAKYWENSVFIRDKSVATY